MPSRVSLIALLAALTATGPFALQALAPALPAVAADFAVDAASAQLLLSLSLAAMAVSTLLWGPLSDRLGRRPVLIAAMWLAAAGSVVGALAPDLWLAVAGRLVQAAGAVAGMVLARAVAQDLYGRDGAAAVIGQITAVMVVAPMIAPVLSGVLVEWTGWRAVFWVVAALTAGLAVLAAARLPETAPRGEVRSWGATLRAFGELARMRDFWTYAAYGVSSLSAFLFFVGSAPFVMTEAYGEGPKTYGFYFMLLAGTYLVANLLCGPVTNRLGGVRTLRLGGFLSLAGVLLGAGLAVAGVLHPLAMFLPVAIQSVGAGISVPNAMAGAVGASPGQAGAASGLMGFCQFLVAGVATQIAGFLPHDSALPTLAAMGLIMAAGLAAHFALSRPSRGAQVLPEG